MKPHLLFADDDFQDAPPPRVDDLCEDLGLDVIFEAMAGGDQLSHEVVSTIVPVGLREPTAMTYRQGVLADCLAHASVVRQLYDLATAALADKKKVWAIMIKSPEGRLRYAVDILDLMVERLRQLRRLADMHASSFGSEGFHAFWSMVHGELADTYFAEVAGHLSTVRGFRDGVSASATLGKGLKATGFEVHRKREPRLSWWQRLWYRPDGLTIVIAPADQGGNQALTELRNRSLNETANTLAQSADHVLSFFAVLRFELAFYLGCLRLHGQLTAAGQPVCFPEPVPADDAVLSAGGLYDPVLALRGTARVVGNDLHADGRDLLLITGANQGGKSTFLRSLGIAQILMQAGMFVPAQSFTAVVRSGVLTHYKREEDATLVTGKLEEELARMSDILAELRPGALLLLNESFSSTNESEGAEIGSSLLRALRESGITVACVTHSFELADRYKRQRDDGVLFLRAERRADGQRTFRIVEDDPRPTSHGDDLYRRIFGRTPKVFRLNGARTSAPRRKAGAARRRSPQAGSH